MPKPDSSRIRRTAAAAAVFDGAGRILLHQRSDNEHWALPGGTVEAGETIEVSIVREVLEETGYVVEVIRLVGVYSSPEHTTFTYAGGDTVHYVSVLFECRVLGGDAALSDETLAVGWYDPADLPQPFHRGHLPRVEDALARREAAFYR